MDKWEDPYQPVREKAFLTGHGMSRRLFRIEGVADPGPRARPINMAPLTGGTGGKEKDDRQDEGRGRASISAESLDHHGGKSRNTRKRSRCRARSCRPKTKKKTQYRVGGYPQKFLREGKKKGVSKKSIIYFPIYFRQDVRGDSKVHRPNRGEIIEGLRWGKNVGRQKDMPVTVTPTASRA